MSCCRSPNLTTVNVLFYSSVTGSSTGFGRLLTEFALEKGDKVVATLRKPEVISDLATKYAGKDQLLVLKVDVTKPEEITSAFQKTEDAFGRIDIVVNNAGYGIIAEVEGTPDADARHLFEVCMIFRGLISYSYRITGCILGSANCLHGGY